MSGYVYLAKAGDYHKIGNSIDPWARITQLVSQLGDIRLVHQIATSHPRRLERAMHATFLSKHAGGEWFSLVDADVASFCSLHECDPYCPPPWVSRDTVKLPKTVEDRFRCSRVSCSMNIKLSEETRYLIDMARVMMFARHGYSLTAAKVVEAAIVLLAERENVPPKNANQRVRMAAFDAARDERERAIDALARREKVSPAKESR